MKINVCGIPHKIVMVDQNFTAGDISHFGEIDYKSAEIRVNKEQNPLMMQETICHEWLHGVLTHLGFAEQAQNEQFVTALGSAIWNTFGGSYFGKVDEV